MYKPSKNRLYIPLPTNIPAEESKLKVVIDQNLCKGCGYCILECPKKILKLSEEITARGYKIVRVTDESQCIGCRKCELICPEMAIFPTTADSEK